MTIQPKNDNVLIEVEIEPKEQKTKSGIYIPKAATGEVSPDRGVVVALGEGRYAADGTRVPVSLKTGDQVIFQRYAGTKMSIGDDEFLMIKENDVLAVINE